MSHTPGPWKTTGYSILAPRDTEPAGLMVIAEVKHIYLGPYRGQSKDNANLIAAAPDLLDACEAIINAVNNDPALQEELVISYFDGDEGLPFARALKMASVALAKAKGIPRPKEKEETVG